MFQLLGKIIYFSTEELSWQDVCLEFSQLLPKAIPPDSKANPEDQKKMKGGKTEPQYLCLSSKTQPDLEAAKPLTVRWQEPRKSLFASRSLSWITVLGPESTQLTPYAITAWNPKECGNLRGGERVPSQHSDGLEAVSLPRQLTHTWLTSLSTRFLLCKTGKLIYMRPPVRSYLESFYFRGTQCLSPQRLPSCDSGN